MDKIGKNLSVKASVINTIQKVTNFFKIFGCRVDDARGTYICMDENKQEHNLILNNSPMPKTPWAFFWYAIKPYKYWMLFSLLIVTIVATVSSGVSYLYKLIIDSIESGDFESALFWGLLFPFILFLIELLHRIETFSTANLTTKSNKYAADNLFDYTLNHSNSYFSDRLTGKIVGKLRNILGAVDNLLPNLISDHYYVLVTFTVSFGLIYSVDKTSAFLFLGLIVCLLLINFRMAPRKAELSRIAADVNSSLGGRISDVITNMIAVRQYTKKRNEIFSLGTLTNDRRIAHYNNWIYSEKIYLINSIVLFVFILGMTWSLMNNWKLDKITTGDFILVLSLVFNVSFMLMFVARVINSFSRTFGELKEGLDDVLVKHEIINTVGAESLKVDQGEIVWQGVDFKFEDNQVFSGFNLDIKGGERVGLVGSSGAGKTTFVSLLLRQHDIDGGKIMIDGQNISRVTQDSLRQAIAVVPQEPALFHRSIKENIAYGKADATMEEIIEVAKKAHAHDFIEKLKDGYDTLVGERGVKLSGGQKQRVAIARAMLKDAPILILDEATSALDSESEVLIQKALHELMVGKTVIAVAHRLSTLREMDRIIVMEAGEIIEDGDHNTLKNNGGVYAKLWGHQSGGFLQDD